MGFYDGRMAVERSRWTDERLDDLAERVVRHDALPEKIDDLGRDLSKQIADLRNELGNQINDVRSDLGGQINAVRSDLGGQITDMRRELYSTRWTIVGIWLGLAAIFIEIALRS